jgi:LmbE family N-acetylglucosaminyl deacetylase
MALKYGKTYDLVVSHDKNGEYGHIQHKRVHIVAKSLARKIGCRFSGFKARYNKAKLDVSLRDFILKDVYKSQKKIIDVLLDYCEKHYTKRKHRD